MRYGYIDESGDIGGSERSSAWMVLALVVVDRPIGLHRAVAKVRRSLNRSRRQLPEFKAGHGDGRITSKLLDRCLITNMAAVAMACDKRLLNHGEKADLYASVCQSLIELGLQRFGSLVITLDKRYTQPSRRAALDAVIAQGVENLNANLVLRHEDSRQEQALQVADAVAWSVFQRYEHGDERYIERLGDRLECIEL